MQKEKEIQSTDQVDGIGPCSGIKHFLSVCVEVLRPSQPNGVMSSAASLPNHTFTWQAVLQAVNQYCAHSFT